MPVLEAQARFIEFQAEKLLRLYFLAQGEPFSENDMIDRIIQPFAEQLGENAERLKELTFNQDGRLHLVGFLNRRWDLIQQAGMWAVVFNVIA